MDTVNYRRHKVYNIRKTVIVVLRHCIISLLALFFLLPIIVLLTRSVMSPDDIYQVPTLLFPTKLDFSGYTKAFDDQILSYLWNTIIVVGVNTVFPCFILLITKFPVLEGEDSVTSIVPVAIFVLE